MQRLITGLLVLAFVSPYLCISSFVGTTNTVYNVIDFGAIGSGTVDDSQAFLKAWQQTCGTQGDNTLLIPAGKVFLVNSITMSGNCTATSISIQLQGEIVAPTKNAWVGNSLNLIMFNKVNGLTIDGSGGLIDGTGSTWWGCNCPRPAVLTFQSCNNLSVKSLTIINSPKAHIHINSCMGAIFSYINISSPGNTPNTDGIDIYYSQNIRIEDSTIASGDDCIAITGDSSYINATRIACGPGHGISIGSLGRDDAYNTVEEVYVQNCSFTNTKNAARIKTWPNGSGFAKKITFEQITLSQSGNPILIDQYYNQYLVQEGVQLSEVTFSGFQGTSATDHAITLNCSSSGCFNIVLDQINIVSSKPGKPAYCSCINAHGTATDTVPDCSCLST
ncbi:probable polygalacturonase At3g15720 [Cajanus cajan]|uniref:Polygalacturonase At3g15720 family n=1 Tax=Cajanus cajan TaxID=3821 RepID=A0A151QPF2_CAJCA|nr:probable polygalacturonase At3g15720 [Cajanus cajan]KYP32122.1 putative polygalacturonase At3g15720 family [Cajanus cajan]